MWRGVAVISWAVLILVLVAQQVLAQGTPQPTTWYVNCTPISSTPSASMPFTATARASTTTVPRVTETPSLTPTASITKFPDSVFTAVPGITQLNPFSDDYWTQVAKGDGIFMDATHRASEATATQEAISLYTPTPYPQWYQVEPHIIKLNVRESPSVNAPLNGSLIANERIYIYGYVIANGYAWGQFGAKQWVALVVLNVDGSIKDVWARAIVP